MSCERPKVEYFNVQVELPRTSRERCGDCWTLAAPKLNLLVAVVCILIGIGIFMSCWWVPVLMARCQKIPELDLKDVSIYEMVVYQNSTTDPSYQVKSHIGVVLSVRNPNTVPKCFSTLKRVYATMVYKDRVILQQVVPLEDYGLKPQEYRNITLELNAEARNPILKEMGSLLDVEIRNAEFVDFKMSFDVRYFRNDRLGKWKRIACVVTLKTPPVYSGGLLSKSYY